MRKLRRDGWVWGACIRSNCNAFSNYQIWVDIFDYFLLRHSKPVLIIGQPSLWKFMPPYGGKCTYFKERSPHNSQPARNRTVTKCLRVIWAQEAVQHLILFTELIFRYILETLTTHPREEFRFEGCPVDGWQVLNSSKWSNLNQRITWNLFRVSNSPTYINCHQTARHSFRTCRQCTLNPCH